MTWSRILSRWPWPLRLLIIVVVLVLRSLILLMAVIVFRLGVLRTRGECLVMFRWVEALVVVIVLIVRLLISSGSEDRVGKTRGIGIVVLAAEKSATIGSHVQVDQGLVY